MTQWWPRGEARRPPLSDKLADWEVLSLIGGQDFVRGHDVLEIGPEYGLDAIMLSYLARRYVIVDNAADVMEHICNLRDLGLVENAEIITTDAQTLAPFTEEFDLVVDFGSIDNTAKPAEAYASACRVLRKHGFLITTYANSLALGEQPLNDGTIPVLPGALQDMLTKHGMWVRNRMREDQPRAVIIAQKGGEPLKGCAWYKTGECTCEKAEAA